MQSRLSAKAEHDACGEDRPREAGEDEDSDHDGSAGDVQLHGVLEVSPVVRTAQGEDRHEAEHRARGCQPHDNPVEATAAVVVG